MTYNSKTLVLNKQWLSNNSSKFTIQGFSIFFFTIWVVFHLSIESSKVLFLRKFQQLQTYFIIVFQFKKFPEFLNLSFKIKRAKKRNTWKYITKYKIICLQHSVYKSSFIFGESEILSEFSFFSSVSDLN